MKTLEDFLSTPERRKHTVNDLKIHPIIIHEMTLAERNEVMKENSDIEDGKDDDDSRLLLMCKQILKSIFGYELEYTDEQALQLQSKYSSDIINAIFERVMSFNGIETKAIEAAKKP